MLFFFQDLADNPLALVAFVAAFGVAIITGIGFHEFAHAWAAYELGDDTAARRGRLTLNPLKHLDPMGTILVFLVGFGWGKPTPVNPYRLRNGPMRGNMMVAAAGPISNFVFAAIAATPLRMGWINSVANLDDMANASGEEIIGLFLFFVVWINIILGIFNLFPIHPLDGFKVVAGVLPADMARQFMQLAQWGPAMLIGLFALSFTPFNPLGAIVGGLGNRIFDLLL